MRQRMQLRKRRGSFAVLDRDRDGWHKQIRGLRAQMVEQTNVFLSWALAGDREVVRIPRRKVNEGRFGPMINQHWARDYAVLWWSKALAGPEGD